METLEKLRNGIDQLPKWLLLVLVIFVDGLVGGLYRAAGKTTEAKVIGWIMAAAYVLSICPRCLPLSRASLPSYAWSPISSPSSPAAKSHSLPTEKRRK